MGLPLGQTPGRQQTRTFQQQIRVGEAVFWRVRFTWHALQEADCGGRLEASPTRLHSCTFQAPSACLSAEAPTLDTLILTVDRQSQDGVCGELAGERIKPPNEFTRRNKPMVLVRIMNGSPSSLEISGERLKLELEGHRLAQLEAHRLRSCNNSCIGATMLATEPSFLRIPGLPSYV